MIDELIFLLNPEIIDANVNNRNLRYQVIRKLNESSSNNQTNQMLVVRDQINQNQLRLAQKIKLTMTNVNEEQRDKCLAKLRILERIGDQENESIIGIKEKFKKNFGANELHLILITNYYEVLFFFFIYSNS